MTDEQLQVIKERADKATPAPWVVDESLRNAYVRAERPRWMNYAIPHGLEKHPAIAQLPNCRNGTLQANRDAKFIARAREDVPQLIAEIERLRDVIPTPELLQKIARLAYESDAPDSADIFIWASRLHGEQEVQR